MMMQKRFSHMISPRVGLKHQSVYQPTMTFLKTQNKNDALTATQAWTISNQLLSSDSLQVLWYIIFAHVKDNYICSTWL